MTQQEIIEYNKRCAEFLGDEGMQKICSDNGHHYPSLEEMLFHSDWNWIIEVLKFITKIGYNWELIDFNGTVEEVNFMKCSIFDLDFDNRIKFVFESSDEKEAVVQAINQFLIWYKENKI